MKGRILQGGVGLVGKPDQTRFLPEEVFGFEIEVTDERQLRDLVWLATSDGQGSGLQED